MTAIEASAAAGSSTFDRLGLLAAGVAISGLALGPFATLKPNRILDGAPVSLFAALSPPVAAAVMLLAAAAAIVVALRTPALLRLLAGLAVAAALLIALGTAPSHLVARDDMLARIGPGWGFWLAFLAFALVASDAIVRLRLRPLMRVAALALVLAGAGALFASGALDDLSLLKEYAPRAQAFWSEARTHLLLSFGSVAAALTLGVPLGLACHFSPRFEGPALGFLTAIQTIPSIALFALLIAPLGWLAANLPSASAVGISGVGIAPAFVALTLYALLPVVAGVASALASTPRDAVEAARASGMTERQALLLVKAPLAAPRLLASLRVTLVQTIGLATVAALIGAGGFGTFVFQGMGQTAIDLVLLGAVPTVALAFAASVALDAAAEAAAR
ncbi:ABC transporter permease [Hansschlegelia quercus]|uniref:ABC transporter permease n=1 Tax=Hansschlegelia quercus TaxID=2528245 RepID=A0A4Q9GNH9_9HYPH|nr:ABC transporter permease [Hansschlegelia quercus]TBN54735.1 ABC transporter permease [Hansschlegelia quercus]